MTLPEDRDIQALIDRYRRLETIVNERMHNILEAGGNPRAYITHRIKTLESIQGKIERKRNVYADVSDMRDILGFRVICFFLGDVDKIAGLLAEHFRVDWSRSKDKRELIDARSFGYVSLHYICALPEDAGELSDLWFEVQIKTMLQHSWAEIEHDLGYKAEIEVPRDVRRSFSRAASLLETADFIFADIRNRLVEYEAEVKDNIRKESLADMSFDAVTLAEFTAHNSTYRSLLNEIAAITNAHITEGNPKNQLPLIDFLGINSLEEMTGLISSRRKLALELADNALRDSELDELSSTVAYHYIFWAELISGGYSGERINEFFMLAYRDKKIADHNTERILKARQSLLKPE